MGSVTVNNSDAPATIATINKIFSVPKGPAPGAAPTASGLQVRCAGRLRVHCCEPRHERFQILFFSFSPVAATPALATN